MFLFVWKQKYCPLCYHLLYIVKNLPYYIPQGTIHGWCKSLSWPVAAAETPSDCSKVKIRPIVERPLKFSITFSLSFKKFHFAFVSTECCVLFSLLQAESPQSSSAHTFNFSETISKLWRTTVVFYSLCWPQSRLWNTPRLPNGTISLPLSDYFCRYTFCLIVWFSIAFCRLYLFMKKCIGMSC